MFRNSIFCSKNVVFQRPIHSTKSSMALNLERTVKCFEGEQRFYSHESDTVKCKMHFGVYVPPKTIKEQIACPVLYFLNGLTGTHENFFVKSGFQRFAANLGICVVGPDTSPREVNVPEHKTLGPGAGFYMDALEEPWAKHYQMYSYVTKELIELINNNLPVIKGKQSIAGFSMGGYGALISSLKNPGLFQSVSAFAPGCNPISGGIYKIALEGYMGKDPEVWKQWDPCELALSYSGNPMEIFIDLGTSDEYHEGNHLMPENLIKSVEKNDRLKIIFKEREGYNHSHYFLKTFIHEHMDYHAEVLNSK